MRDVIFIIITMVIVWSVVFFALPQAGFPLANWALVVLASLSAIFSGLLALMGQTIVEDIVIVGILLILSGILWFTEIGFVSICALSSGFIGVFMNQINKAVYRTP
jgi:hypothetical protein